jgi:hypothetical protein
MNGETGFAGGRFSRDLKTFESLSGGCERLLLDAFISTVSLLFSIFVSVLMPDLDLSYRTLNIQINGL